MLDPRSTSPDSIMPTYPWLYDTNLDTSLIQKKLSVMRTLGVPYTDAEQANAVSAVHEQAQKIADELFSQGVPRDEKLKDREIIALIGYLQRLGMDTKKR